MADPVTIIGLVSGIITFVDFGYKIVNGAKELRDLGKGTTQEIAELDAIVGNIRTFNKLVKDQIPAKQKLSDEEQRTSRMVNDCELLCAQLSALISKLTTRNSSLFGSILVASKSAIKKGEIQELKRRLESLSQQIGTTLQHALQEDRHTSIISKLREVELLRRELGVEQNTKLDALKTELVQLAKVCQEQSKEHQGGRANVLESMITNLKTLQQEHVAMIEQVRVLESLYFTDITRRYDMIPDADQRTNEWVYDATKTSFTQWLESTEKDDGLFYIIGKAGSGKSTLMKRISAAQETERSLKEWAGNRPLYIGEYFFWNQGSDMQKSSIGLFQTLLYQILKAAPELAPEIGEGHLHHETWNKRSLLKAFEHVTRKLKLDSRFCFFIDGLDEYDGEEKDVIEILRILSSSGHVKICASSRPERIYEAFFYNSGLRERCRTFNIADFTKNDMRVFAYARLHDCEKFRHLAYIGETGEMIPICQAIIDDISEKADGVWLWVFLVTHQLVRQIERDESFAVLWKVVGSFPADLKKFFERIIQKIDDIHKEEMAQTFLVTVDELQPLPLYAFRLLERERDDPEYAIREAIRPLQEDSIFSEYEAWKSRLWNRCGDLLVVDDKPHAVFLSHSVDFLHRTVRDFLRDTYQAQLRDHLKTNFDSLVSLSRISLCFLKGLPDTDFRERKTVNRIIGVTDQLLYYAHEFEKRHPDDDGTPLVAVLDELDRVNSHFARNINNHWTHARDTPQKQGFDKYIEGGRCNFLALTVQARLVQYVRAKLLATPGCLQKPGRPLLDYALRPLRTTPIEMPFHSMRGDSAVDITMIKLLIENGADPNQQVHLNNGETVWGLFLISMHSTREEVPDNLQKAWYKACIMLIKAGARSDYKFVHSHYRGSKDVASVLKDVFGAEKVIILEQTMASYQDLHRPNTIWGALKSFVVG